MRVIQNKYPATEARTWLDNFNRTPGNEAMIRAVRFRECQTGGHNKFVGVLTAELRLATGQRGVAALRVYGSRANLAQPARVCNGTQFAAGVVRDQLRYSDPFHSPSPARMQVGQVMVCLTPLDEPALTNSRDCLRIYVRMLETFSEDYLITKCRNGYSHIPRPAINVISQFMMEAENHFNFRSFYDCPLPDWKITTTGPHRLTEPNAPPNWQQVAQHTIAGRVPNQSGLTPAQQRILARAVAVDVAANAMMRAPAGPTVQAGKYYIDGDGDIIGPMKVNRFVGSSNRYPWQGPKPDSGLYTYTDQGRHTDEPTSADLMMEGAFDSKAEAQSFLLSVRTSFVPAPAPELPADPFGANRNRRLKL